MAGTKQSDTMWERLMKHVALEKPQSSWNTRFGNEKLPSLGDSSANMLPGRTTWRSTQKNMRWKEMRSGKQENRAVTQSLHTLRRRPPVEQELEKGWRIIKSLLLQRPQALIFIAHRQA